ncbi:MAG: flagellar motor switch protein FliG [Hyphomonadaceae bacterium]|nr:flagellar motor switch protein FliG [Hyphomonadaceae bacterium]
MSAPAQAKPAAPEAASLTGAEKVAVLLLALGKPRAAKLLKRFDPEELKVLTQLAGDLAPIGASDLEVLVEEFAQRFSSGINFVGTEKEVKSLLSDVMGEDQLAGVMADEQEEPGEAPERVWDKISRIKDDTLRAYLGKEHPQTAAMILSRIDPATAARIVGAFPAQQRNGLLIRMLGIKKVDEDAARAVELAIAEDLLAKTSSGSHAGIADILNRLDKTQSDDLLKDLASVRPDDAKTLKSMLFTFVELVNLPAKARTLLLDQVPIERLVAALKGTDSAFQATILSSLTARSRRMVEAELQGGGSASEREVADARRAIVDTVLKMMAKGEIAMPEPDAVDDLTV